MTGLLLAVRLVLAAVFLVAGAAKLADRRGSREALVAFGLPERSSGPLAVLLPLVELAVAAALLPETTTWWGAAGALVLLVAFMLAIAVSLARGRTPDCHCFGQLHSAPAGPSTLIRNGVLAAAAMLVLIQGRHSVGPSAVAWVADVGAAGWAVLVGAALAIVTLMVVVSLLLALLRQNGRLVLRVEALEAKLAHDAADGLPVGASAPAFELRALGGPPLTLAELLAAQRPVLLVFTEPHCGPCAALIPEIAQWQDNHADHLTIAVVSRRDRGAKRELTKYGLRYVLLQKAREVSVAYGVAGTPSAVLIAADGTIASSPAAGADAIRRLVSDAVGLPPAFRNGTSNGNAWQSPPWGAKPGEPAPDFLLADLSGALFELSDLRGHNTVLLFWDPGCGFCRAMLEDLRAWERERPMSAPTLVVISAGDTDVNRALGLHSLILLDQDGQLRRPYGIPGTPSAVLVDAQNKIASEVAVGADAVLALAGFRLPVHA
jgi:methylamine dehydrogenase accessory protein MauD